LVERSTIIYCSTINDFPKTKKIAERYINTNEIALEELKAKELNENTNKGTKF
jgi:hypothetical protein